MQTILSPTTGLQARRKKEGSERRMSREIKKREEKTKMGKQEMKRKERYRKKKEK